jgi:hypothetical protein
VIQSSIVNEKSLKNLDRCIVGLAIAMALILIGLLTSTAIQFFSKRGALGNVATAKSEVKNLNETIDRAKKLKRSAKKVNPTSAVQEIMDNACKVHKVTMVDFQANGDPAPFLSRYKKNGSESGWLQAGVTAQIRGRLNDCYLALKDVLTSSVPTELDNLEIQKGAGETDGNNVTFKLVFRVLKQEVTQ